MKRKYNNYRDLPTEMVEKFADKQSFRMYNEEDFREAAIALYDHLYPQKFIFIELKEINGERTYNHRLVHQIPLKTDEEKWAEGYCKNFYGRPGEINDDSGYYEFDCGEVAVRVDRVQVIRKDEYEVMRKFF